MTAVWIVLALLVLGAVLVVVLYNRLVRLRNRVQESWRQIDVELNRRHDLIPNLVETVKGYAAHERETLEAVVQARTAAATTGSSPAEQARQEGALGQALGRLFALAESYPDLKANTNFLELQRELSDTEDRIAAGRRYYNASVRELTPPSRRSRPTSSPACSASAERSTSRWTTLPCGLCRRSTSPRCRALRGWRGSRARARTRSAARRPRRWPAGSARCAPRRTRRCRARNRPA